jgi:hypothetical protein
VLEKRLTPPTLLEMGIFRQPFCRNITSFSGIASTNSARVIGNLAFRPAPPCPIQCPADGTNQKTKRSGNDAEQRPLRPGIEDHRPKPACRDPTPPMMAPPRIMQLTSPRGAQDLCLQLYCAAMTATATDPSTRMIHIPWKRP